MADDNKISIDVELAIAQAQRDIQKIQQQFTVFGNETTKQFARIDQGVTSFKGTLVALQADKAIAFVTEQAKRLFQTFIVDGVKASAAAEEATNSLNASLAQTGKYTKENSKFFQDLASDIQATTKIEDDNVKQAEALIQTLGNLDQKGLARATHAAVDLAAALSSKGVSLTSAADLVGKAAAGNTGALGRYGIVIDETGTKAQRFTKALDMIEQKFGGRAVAEVKTYNGAVEQASNIFGDLQESTGDLVTQNAIVVNAIKATGKGFADLTTWVKANKAEMNDFISQGILRTVDGLALLLDVGDGTIRFFTSLGLVVKGSAQLIIGQVFLMSSAILTLLDSTLGKALEIAGIENPFKNLAEAARSTTAGLGQDILETGKKIADTMGTKGALGNVADYVRGAREELATHVNDVIDANDSIRNQDQQTLEGAVQAELVKRHSFLETLFLQYDLMKQEEDLSILKAQLAQAEGEKRIAIAQKVAQAENAITATRVQNFKDSLTTIATLQQSKVKEFFYIGKAAALASAVINGAEAVTKAFGQTGILGFIMGPLVTLAVGAQIATIASQGPGFATGGIVGGTTPFGDVQNVRANSEEMFITKQQQAGLFNFLASGSPGAGAGGDTFIFQNPVFDSSARIDELIEAVNSRTKNGVPLFASRLVA